MVQSLSEIDKNHWSKDVWYQYCINLETAEGVLPSNSNCHRTNGNPFPLNYLIKSELTIQTIS